MTRWRTLLRYDWPLHFILYLTNWLPDNVIFLTIRGSLVRPFLGKCGKNLKLGRNLTFYNPSRIHIGNDVYIAYGCWLAGGGVISIEKEVLIGPYCVIVAGSHLRKDLSFRFGETRNEGILIGAGSWISAHVTISGGSKIGVGCLVAANAAVSGTEFPPRMLCGGVPAKVIKPISDSDFNE